MSVHLQILDKLPEYFLEHVCKCPRDIKSGLFQFARNYNDTYFEGVQSVPEQQDIDQYMALTGLERVKEWFALFHT